MTSVLTDKPLQMYECKRSGKPCIYVESRKNNVTAESIAACAHASPPENTTHFVTTQQYSIEVNHAVQKNLKKCLNYNVEMFFGVALPEKLCRMSENQPIAVASFTIESIPAVSIIPKPTSTSSSFTPSSTTSNPDCNQNHHSNPDSAHLPINNHHSTAFACAGKSDSVLQRPVPNSRCGPESEEDRLRSRRAFRGPVSKAETVRARRDKRQCERH